MPNEELYQHVYPERIICLQKYDRLAMKLTSRLTELHRIIGV